MSKLILRGALADKYGAEHSVRTDNLSEAIRIVDANHPGFRTSFGIDQEYAVFVNDKNIQEKDLIKKGDMDTIWTIEPVPYGSGGNGGVLSVVLGVVMIAVGYFTFGTTSAWGVGLIGAGIGAVVSGLSSFLAPAIDTSTSTSDEDKSSYLFSGPTNKTKSGHARPICYGEVYASTINVGFNFKHEDLINVTE